MSKVRYAGTGTFAMPPAGLGVVLGQHLESLENALVDRFPAYDDASRFFRYGVERKLPDVVGPGGLRTVIFNALLAAEAEGWIGDLIHAATIKWPDEQAFATLATAFPVEHRRRTVSGDPMDFDMRVHVDKVRAARMRCAGNLVGVAVHDVDDAYLERLHRRIVDKLRASPRCTWYKLDDGYKGPADLAADVRAATVPTLTHQVVVIPIRIQKDSVASVQALWSALGEGSATWRQHLVVLFVVDAGVIGALPEEIVPLPAPEITEDDIGHWVEDLVPDWPPRRMQLLADRIHRCVLGVAEAYRWMELYIQLEKCIVELSTDYEVVVDDLDRQGAS